MINPQELRIGNYFSPTIYAKGLRMPSGAVGKIQTLRFESVEWVHYNQIPAQVEIWPITLYSEMEPIPITEEWLERFGFDNHELILPYHGAFQSYLIAEIGAARVQICKNGYFAYDPEIRYVHQLQNLYFALTGQELTIANPTETHQ